MKKMSYLSFAWICFVGVLLIEVIVDYLFRRMSDDFYQSGIDETIWFLIQIGAVGIAVYYLLKSTRKFESKGTKAGYFLLNIVAGIFFYILLIYSYILGLGIDSF